MTSETFHLSNKNVLEFRFELTLICTSLCHLVSVADSVPDSCKVLDDKLRSANAPALSSCRFSLCSSSASSRALCSSAMTIICRVIEEVVDTIINALLQKVFRNNVKEEIFQNYVKAIKDSDLGPSGVSDNVVNLQQQLKQGKNAPGKTNFSKTLHCNVGVGTHHFGIVLTSSSASALEYSSRRSTLMASISSSLFCSFLSGSFIKVFTFFWWWLKKAAGCATATSIWPPCTCAPTTGGPACAVRAACAQLCAILLEASAAAVINDC